MRELSPRFMGDLINGYLNGILDYVINDETLCLEIREDYIDIYYRGGRLFEVKKSRNGFYEIKFDQEYMKKYPLPHPVIPPKSLKSKKDVELWLQIAPNLKHIMDYYFGTVKSSNEREFQQVVVRENNFGKSAKGSDYFIIDIEYHLQNKKSFDMIAIKWMSDTSSRGKQVNLGLAIIEMKYMDNAISGRSGLLDHIHDANLFCSTQKNIIDLKDEMKKVFNQKRDLKLIKNQRPIISFDNNAPEYIIILANHDPGSSKLRNELQRISKILNLNFTIKIAVSNFMGYCLYDQCIYDLKQFQQRFAAQI